MKVSHYNSQQMTSLTSEIAIHSEFMVNSASRHVTQADYLNNIVKRLIVYLQHTFKDVDVMEAS